jgi:hypothetical protein
MATAVLKINLSVSSVFQKASHVTLQSNTAGLHSPELSPVMPATNGLLHERYFSGEHSVTFLFNKRVLGILKKKTITKSVKHQVLTRSANTFRP